MSASKTFGVACKTCRRRGRKCDRTLPKCLSCRRRGAECEGYPFRWIGQDTYGATSIVHASTPASKQVPLRDETPTIGLDAPDTREPSRQGIGKQQSGVASPALQRPPRRDLIALRKAQPSQLCDGIPGYIVPKDSVRAFVGYYANEISTAFFLGHGPAQTPYSQYVLPMTRNVASIRYAVAATASCHIANRVQNGALAIESLQLRVEATQALRSELAKVGAEVDISGVACMILLAQLDLCSGDCLEFGTHLKAASDVIGRRGSDGTEGEFFKQRLAWLDIMGSTTSSRKPNSSPSFVKAALNQFKTADGRRWGFDVFECPIDLFEYISDVTFLYKFQQDPTSPSDETLRQAIILGNATRTWTPPLTLSRERLQMVEIWRHGVLLYLVHLFRLPNQVFDTDELLDQVFSRAEHFTSETSRQFSISWPLFQAGLSLPGAAHGRKKWLRDDFSWKFKTRGCIHPRLALQVLERVWTNGKDHLLSPQTIIC